MNYNIRSNDKKVAELTIYVDEKNEITTKIASINPKFAKELGIMAKRNKSEDNVRLIFDDIKKKRRDYYRKFADFP